MIELFAPALSVTVAPLAQQVGGNVRRGIERARATGIHAVQLSAAQPGIRPRDLDRRARRDVLALLSRNGLMLSGLDLMIPHRHWLDPTTQDRAFEAMLHGLALAYDLGKVPLATTLPVADMPEPIMRELLTAADARGIAIAVHAEHDLEGLSKFLTQYDQPILGAAVDPAALIAEDVDPADAVGRLSDRLLLARLDDHAQTSVASSGGRVPVGRGSLDLLSYQGALSIGQRVRSIVVELRDLPDPFAAAVAARHAWEPEAV